MEPDDNNCPECGKEIELLEGNQWRCDACGAESMDYFDVVGVPEFQLAQESINAPARQPEQNIPHPFDEATPEQVQAMAAEHAHNERTCMFCGSGNIRLSQISKERWNCLDCGESSWNLAAQVIDLTKVINTIEVKHDLLRFSDGHNIMSRPADEVRDLSVLFIRSNGTDEQWNVLAHGPNQAGVYVNIWSYECNSKEEAHELHDRVFNAWVEARVVARRSR